LSHSSLRSDAVSDAASRAAVAAAFFASSTVLAIIVLLGLAIISIVLIPGV